MLACAARAISREAAVVNTALTGTAAAEGVSASCCVGGGGGGGGGGRDNK